MDKYKWLKDSFLVNILGKCLSPTDVVHNMGVLFDSKFSFTNNVNFVVLLTFKICIVSDAFYHMTSQSWYQMHWSVVVWIIAVLCFTVCPPRISLQGFKISKIILHTDITRLQNIQNCFASLMLQDLVMPLQP